MRYFFLVSIGLCIAGILIFGAARKDQDIVRVISTESFSPAEVRSAFARAIKKHGHAKAYEQMKAAAATRNAAQAHLLAHMFGTVLFKQVGLAGLKTCDAAFGFGCYHSFFGAAVAEHRADIILKLDQLCIEAHGPMGLGCFHGIGHGLGEYYGPHRLDKQLEWCARLSWKGRYMGCQSGVFMEYNVPTTIENEMATTGVRAFEESRPYGICLNIPTRFQPACFLELTGWWEHVLARDYKKIGALCDLVADSRNRESCFLGIGYALVQSNGYDVAQTTHSCAQMPKDADELLCLAGASWSFFANPDHRDKAHEVCGTQECTRKADLLSYE